MTSLLKNSLFLFVLYLNHSFSYALESSITEPILTKHVVFLSSNRLKGRLTGSHGERLATQYIADLFSHWGLTPMGTDNTFFQTFSYLAGKGLGKNNALLIHNNDKITHLELGTDWFPLSFSTNFTFDPTQMIFAGYGITAPNFQKIPAYDSYQDLAVKNKWVVVLRHTPKTLSKEEKDYLRSYSTMRYKAFIAKEHGALGIVFLNEGKLNTRIISHSFNAGIGAIVLSAARFQKNQIPKLSGKIELIDRIKQGRNVLGKISVGTGKKGFIILGAHIDHLGQTAQHTIYPGADDNASGVSSLLTIASQLCKLREQGKLSGDKDILIAAWSGEELGLLGSTHFVNEQIKQSENKSLRPTIDAVINLDMIGHLRDALVIQGIDSSKEWSPFITVVNQHHKLALVMQEDSYLPTDSTTFYINQVPALNFFTGAHPAYHTPADRADTINYTGLKTISEFLLDLILTLEQHSNLLSYNKIENKHTSTIQTMQVYLGTIPDYSSTQQGVKISGIKNYSPAQRAGMKPNDIVIELGNTKIHDIYDYTFALNKLPIGKPIPMVVLREGKKTILSVVGQHKT